jgi:hypothetical protein
MQRKAFVRTAVTPQCADSAQLSDTSQARGLRACARAPHPDAFDSRSARRDNMRTQPAKAFAAFLPAGYLAKQREGCLHEGL